MRPYGSALFLTALVLSTGPRAAGQPVRVTADSILINGKIWTVNKAQPEAEGIAVWRGRIIAVGSNAKVEALRGPDTQVIDLKGRRVVPGFYDSHIHLLGSGQRLSEVALKDAASEAEFGRRLRDFDRKLARDARTRRRPARDAPFDQSNQPLRHGAFR